MATKSEPLDFYKDLSSLRLMINATWESIKNESKTQEFEAIKSFIKQNPFLSLNELPENLFKDLSEDQEPFNLFGLLKEFREEFNQIDIMSVLIFDFISSFIEENPNFNDANTFAEYYVVFFNLLRLKKNNSTLLTNNDMIYPFILKEYPNYFLRYGKEFEVSLKIFRDTDKNCYNI